MTILPPKEIPIGCFGIGTVIGAVHHTLEHCSFPVNQRLISNCFKGGIVTSIGGTIVLGSLNLMIEGMSKTK